MGKIIINARLRDWRYEGAKRTANVKPDAEIITSAPEKNTKPPLPQLPQISQKSTNNQLPELPKLP